MSYLKSTQYDLNKLKDIFTNIHERFRILGITDNRLSCRFIGKNDKEYDIHAKIPNEYPSKPLVWYTDDDEKGVKDIADKLNETHRDQPISNQINILLRELCRQYEVELPKGAIASCSGEGSSVGRIESSNAQKSQNEAIIQPDQTVDSDSDELESEEDETDNSPEKADESDYEPSLKRALLKLEKSGSKSSSSRLMKELIEIYRSVSHKNGEYSVNLVDDSIYEWEVDLRSIDKDSELYKDLMKLKEKKGKDCITLNMTFNDKYPIEPPFVRVVHPVLICKHVVGGGAICTELLLKQCWSPLYTTESVIIQMAALFVKGNARIAFDSKAQYSSDAAKFGFLEVTGAKMIGWFDQFKDSS